MARSELLLLRENQVAGAFRKAMRKASSGVVAVPFWGNGAVVTLGLSEASPIRVICNLGHPGCNPDVIEELRLLKIKVRTHPRLHAKIYATPIAVIVGSSNVSTNGLTVEGSQAKGWVEANVYSNAPGLVADVLQLFESLWKDPETRRVRAADIKAAQKARAARPPILDALRSTTLLAACRENPAVFGSVYVAAYTEDLGAKGAELLKAVKQGSAPPKAGLSASDFRRAWGYQMEDIPEGAWLLDLDCKRPGKAKVSGYAQATGCRMPADDETDLTIALPRPIVIAGRTFKLSSAEKASLVASGEAIAAEADDGLLLLSKAIEVLDRTT